MARRRRRQIKKTVRRTVTKKIVRRSLSTSKKLHYQKKLYVQRAKGSRIIKIGEVSAPIKKRAFKSPEFPVAVQNKKVFDRALTCAKRKQRREIIHATKKYGRGNKTPTFNLKSKIRC